MLNEQSEHDTTKRSDGAAHQPQTAPCDGSHEIALSAAQLLGHIVSWAGFTLVGTRPA